MSGDLSRERLPLPIKFQGVDSGGSLIDIYQINADGSITFLTAIDPLDASLVNFGITSSAAEINLLDGEVASISWAVTAGATNVCVGTFTLKDAAGATLAGRRMVRVYIAEDANGDSVSSDSYSTGAAVTDGTEIAAVVASSDKVFDIMTGADGIGAVSITDSGTPADQYFVAVSPLTGKPFVSAASGTTWGA